MLQMQTKRKTELLKMSNSFNRAATEKETELDTVQAKNV